VAPEHDLAAIVVSYGASEQAARLLASFATHGDRGLQIEWVIVENKRAAEAATIAAARTAAASGVHARVVVGQGNVGYAQGCNLGARHSTAPHLAFLNADVVFREPVLARLATQLSRETGLIGPRIALPSGAREPSARAFPTYAAAIFNRQSWATRWLPTHRLSARYLGTDRDVAAGVQPVDWISGAAMVATRRAFEQVRGFDPGFFLYCEDTDLCRRMRDAGIGVAWDPAVTIVHDHGSDDPAVSARKLDAHHRSMWRYYRRHFQRSLWRDAVTGIGVTARWLGLKALAFARGAKNAAGTG
jgi:GT2 family glycosyltransferase